MNENNFSKYNSFCIETSKILVEYVNELTKMKYLDHPSSNIFSKLSDLKLNLTSVLEKNLSDFKVKIEFSSSKLVCIVITRK